MSKQSERFARMMEKVNRDRGVEITYRREESTIGPLMAVPTKLQNITVAGQSVQTAYCDREYLVKKALLTIDGEQIEPKSGDIIIENGSQYEVGETRDANQCFRPMDATDTFLRIFTFNRQS